MSTDAVQGIKNHSLPYNVSWYGVTTLALLGVLVVGFSGQLFGWVMILLGISVLFGFTLITSWQTTATRAARPTGGRSMILVGATGFFLTLILASELIPTEIEISFVGRLVLLVTGTQALFVSISVHRKEMVFARRVVIPAVGHILLGVGSILLIIAAFRIPDTRVFQGVVLWYATGLSALVLNAFWLGQRSHDVTPPLPNSISGYWEKILLGAILVGISSLVFLVFTSIDEPLTFEVASLGRPWTFESNIEEGAATVVGACAVIAFATLAAPPSAPAFVQQFDRTGITIGLHSLTAVVLLNTLLLGLLFLLPSSLGLIFGVLIALVVIAVIIDYLRVGYIRRQQDGNSQEQAPAVPEQPPVTVVVVAYNEADVLPQTLERNLAALSGLPFLLIPAANSTDETVDVAHEYQNSYPDRIRVMEGNTGSKAGDLNQAWSAIETPFVLILDADEIATLAFVSRAVSVLEDAPNVGIVQARKVAHRQSRGWMTRFVSAERRVETWINHQFIHNLFGTSHFAGSAAVLRHEVPQAVDGWSTKALTEDIDLTVRLYLETDWEIRYNSDLPVYNLPPASIISLIRQRRRWARGWVEVTWRYTRDIVRNRTRLGRNKTFGLLWELFSTVSAPFYLVSVAVTLFIFAGLGSTPPFLLAVFLAIFLLPSRGIIFAYAAYNDPITPISSKMIRGLGVVFFAYLWIFFMWLIQLHVLYLQLAGDEKQWEVTNKSATQ